MKGGAIAAGGGILAVFALILGLILASTSSASANACVTAATGTVDAARIPQDANVSGFGRDQLTNAAAIVNAAVAMKLPAAAQTLGVQAAIGESSLVNIAHGDGAINPDGSAADSIGLFQQQSSWGTTAQRRDPTAAATLFFERLAATPDWESLDTSVAINKVQRNSDPYHYAKYRQPAVAIVAYLADLSPASADDSCKVSADAVALSQQLVAAIDNGTLHVQEARMAQQVRDMAAGTPRPNCHIDVPVLQLITLALRKFGDVGISDLNRLCVGSNLGTHAHWDKGGGNAVDFTSLNGRPVNGSSPATTDLLNLLASVAPQGTRIGQINCRPSSSSWPNLTGLYDSCDHQHIDFLYATGNLITQ